MRHSLLLISSFFLCFWTVNGALTQVREVNSTNATNQTAKKWRHFECGTNITHAPQDLLDMSKKLHEEQKKSSIQTSSRLRLSRRALRAQNTIVIPVYINVITRSGHGDEITDDMVQDQIKTMNNAYNKHFISFTLTDIKRIEHDSWAMGEGSSSEDLKKELRRGNYSTLNMYFQTDIAGGVLGRCTMPSSIGDGTVDPSVYVSDGCNINAGTMPGGVIDGFNMGMTAVHEIGHWLGLLHTFEGYSCEGDGDLISDTPSQSTSTEGCPVLKNSCPGRSQGDLVHNYMDYSDDSCYNSFTDGQELRMHDNWKSFRAGK